MIRLITIFALGLLSFSNAHSCDTFGSADYYDMMEQLAKNNKDSAFSILQEQHCSDSVAWKMANDLVQQKIKPENLYRNLIQKNCSKNWIYANIPIFYIQFFQKREDKLKAFDIISKILDKAKCAADVRNALEIDVSTLDGYSFESDSSIKK